MNISLFILVVSSLVGLAFPAVLLGKNGRSKAHRALFLFSATIVTWIICSFLVDYVKNYDVKLWLCRVCYALGLIMAIALYRFTWYYPKKRMPQKKIWQGYYLLVTIGVFFTLFSDTVVKSLIPGEHVSNIVAGPFYAEYTIFLAIGFIFAALRLWWERRTTDDIRIRSQISYFELGLAVGVIWGLMTAVILPVVVPNWETVIYAPLTSLIIIVPMVYAMLRERLMDVRLLVVRIFAYLFSFAAVFGSCLGLIVAWKLEVGTMGVAVIGVIVMTLLLVTEQVVQYFDQLLRHYFFHDAYEGRELLTQFTKIISGKNDLAEILAKTAQLVEQALAVHYAVFGVRKGEEPIGRVVSGHGKLPTELDIARLYPQLLHTRKRLIYTKDLSSKHRLLRNKLLQHNIGLVIRLARTSEPDKQLGYLLVSARKNTRHYTRQDIKLVTGIADGLAPVIEKSLTVEQDFEHVTQEMYRKNLELVETNRTLSLLRAIDALVLESQDSLEVLSTSIAKAITNNSNFTSVAVFARMPGKADLELFGRSIPATSKVETEVLPKIALDPDDSWLKGTERSLRLSVNAEQLARHKELGLTRDNIAALYSSSETKMIYFLKLQARQKVVGSMAIGFVNDNEALTPEDINLLERLSDAVGVAIDNRLLFEENQKVLKQLQKTNDKLRALDEAKDEFISMASHQLRTPLTSVKGYVSMVIEGDAGKLNKMQQDLLGQAFASSQRMVYLIADLLNVSRLRTGKFVIENKPTQLADVVETELSQLQEAAKSKKQSLTFKKPKKFPELMLDETKIRQVVMNFTDNALYYTPAGGKIVVNLEHKGNTVEFTVVDNGIGVPKEEQHKLFAKFYRAGNARKARPDGTGLGLFMAKKVIIAQGGAVIFKTAENKGSTFGFSFAVDKHKVPANVKVADTPEGMKL